MFLTLEPQTLISLYALAIDLLQSLYSTWVFDVGVFVCGALTVRYMHFVTGELFMKIKEKDAFELKNFSLTKACLIFESNAETSANEVCLDRMKICNTKGVLLKGHYEAFRIRAHTSVTKKKKYREMNQMTLHMKINLPLSLDSKCFSLMLANEM